MNQNKHNSFKEEIELFIQMMSVETQFERLLKIESIYYTLSKKEQELIYEEFKRLLEIQNEKHKYSKEDDFFFGGGNQEEVEPEYCKSKLYKDLLNRYNSELLDTLFDFGEEFSKIPKEEQKKLYKSIRDFK